MSVPMKPHTFVSNLTMMHSEPAMPHPMRAIQGENEATLDTDSLLMTQILDFAIVFLDTAGIITRWSTGAQEMFGYLVPEVLGQSVDLIYIKHGDGNDPSKMDMEQAQTARRYKSEGWCLRKDGSMLWASIFWSALYDNQGQVMGFIVLLQDETESKLQEVALKSAKEEADLASQRKNQFLANISHELRTPLHTIISGTSIIQEGMLGPLNEKQAQYLSLIYHSGEHLLQLINDILDTAKIEAGKFCLHWQPIALNTFIEEAQALVVPLLQKKDQSLVFILEPNLPPTLHGDPVRLKQVLCNLLSNAHKFSDIGTPIELHCYAGQNEEVVFAIRDQGPGIAPTELEKILQPFEQGNTSNRNAEKGTGLGLPLALKIIELHGGYLVIHSELGVGSEFAVHLPLNLDQAPVTD